MNSKYITLRRIVFVFAPIKVYETVGKLLQKVIW